MGCNGCTDCCKVPVIWDGLGNHKIADLKSTRSIPMGWNIISKRRAKKRHKFVVDMAKAFGSKKPTYFSCDHLTDNGCGIHKESPYVCHSYPVYEKDLTQFKELYLSSRTEYSEHCNLVEELLTVETEEEWKIIATDRFHKEKY